MGVFLSPMGESEGAFPSGAGDKGFLFHHYLFNAAGVSFEVAQCTVVDV
jgi:hypothetical protein